MRRFCFALLALIISAAGAVPRAAADGLVIRARDYKGSLEEKGQEALILFQSGGESGKSIEHLILKIQVRGEAQKFAWVIPFPDEPKVAKEDPKLFAELFRYCEARRAARPKRDTKSEPGARAAAALPGGVEVLSRQVVGEFDVAIVQENEAGALNPWLEKEGFQTLKNADDVLDFYRKKRYVYACIKVDAAALAEKKEIESHPLRFTFETGGRDGIYFPMKLTSLQEEPFDVNLYVLYRFWLNDSLSKYGYRHRGFQLRYRDWDTEECEPNGGKSYSLPQEDPFLASHTLYFPTVTKLCQKLHPGEKYYLTNIQARGLNPADVRQWADDLWLFPYYTNKNFVPYDARRGGVASAAWPNEGSE